MYVNVSSFDWKTKFFRIFTYMTKIIIKNIVSANLHLRTAADGADSIICLRTNISYLIFAETTKSISMWGPEFANSMRWREEFTTRLCRWENPNFHDYLNYILYNMLYDLKNDKWENTLCRFKRNNSRYIFNKSLWRFNSILIMTCMFKRILGIRYV